MEFFRRIACRYAVAIGLMAASASLAAPSPQDPFRRVAASDDRMVEIRKAETRAFDFDRLAGLPGWQGAPLDADAVAGRLLVLLAWDQADPKSVRLLPTLSRLQRTRGESAAFVAVHIAEGWDAAAQKIDAGRVPIPAAHDADGSLLESLAVNEHPNLYVIDRSGHVRIADLDPRDLPKALAALAKETPEEARADLSRRIAAFSEARRLVAPTRDRTPSNGGGPAETESERPMNPASGRPSASAYAAANWPDQNRDQFRATNVQGQTLSTPLGEEKWLSPRPAGGALVGKVLVVDFWATWCPPCVQVSPALDALQQRHRGDLQVLAVSGQATSGAPEDEQTIRNHMRSHRVSYAFVHDSQQRVYRSLRIRAIPHALVMSTDGVVRWQGNPLSADFQRVVAQVIEADPMIAARRAQTPTTNSRP